MKEAAWDKTSISLFEWIRAIEYVGNYLKGPVNFYWPFERAHNAPGREKSK